MKQLEDGSLRARESLGGDKEIPKLGEGGQVLTHHAEGRHRQEPQRQGRRRPEYEGRTADVYQVCIRTRTRSGRSSASQLVHRDPMEFPMNGRSTA